MYSHLKNNPFLRISSIAVLLCSTVSLFGCQKAEQSATSSSPKGTYVAKAGPPPIPANLSPEIQARIAQEQAAFKARSEMQAQHAMASAQKR